MPQQLDSMVSTSSSGTRPRLRSRRRPGRRTLSGGSGRAAGPCARSGLERQGEAAGLVLGARNSSNSRARAGQLCRLSAPGQQGQELVAEGEAGRTAPARPWQAALGERRECGAACAPPRAAPRPPSRRRGRCGRSTAAGAPSATGGGRRSRRPPAPRRRRAGSRARIVVEGVGEQHHARPRRRGSAARRAAVGLAAPARQRAPGAEAEQALASRPQRRAARSRRFSSRRSRAAHGA